MCGKYRADATAECGGFLTPPPSRVITAGGSVITYDYQTELPFGPPLYSATIAGPMASAISTKLRKRMLFAPRAPHQPHLGWYAFAEWRGNSGGRGATAISIVDLTVGEIVATRKMHFGSFLRDAKTGNERLLFSGGIEGHLSADEKHLFVIHTRADVFVALVSIDSGAVVDRKEAADFQCYVQEMNGLDPVASMLRHPV